MRTENARNSHHHRNPDAQPIANALIQKLALTVSAEILAIAERTLNVSSKDIVLFARAQKASKVIQTSPVEQSAVVAAPSVNPTKHVSTPTALIPV